MFEGESIPPYGISGLSGESESESEFDSDEGDDRNNASLGALKRSRINEEVFRNGRPRLSGPEGNQEEDEDEDDDEEEEPEERKFEGLSLLLSLPQY